MNKYIIREKNKEYNTYNAGSKARNDVDEIAVKNGYQPIEISYGKNKGKGILYSIRLQFIAARSWKRVLSDLPDKSVVLVQFPVYTHTMFLGFILKYLKKKDLFTIALIHDLDFIRNAEFYKANKKKSTRMKYEEVLTLKRFSHVIAHNESMKNYIIKNFGMDSSRISTIQIFDYLIPAYEKEEKYTPDHDDSIIIAGNLDKEKSAYIYKLPNELRVKLFGMNYSGASDEFKQYEGAFLPEELPFHLQGKFGLVWDGDEIETCSGIYGNYLRYNNPHKTSLYLACGIPVIVWKEAAIASYVLNNNCGIAIDSLSDLPGILKELDDREYSILEENAKTIGYNLRNGYYTCQQLK